MTDAVTLIFGYYFKHLYLHQNKGNLNTWTADNKLFVHWRDDTRLRQVG